MFGWKKAIKTYHYYPNQDNMTSLCCKTSYKNSEFKDIAFLSDSEIEPGMIICRNCYTLRQSEIRELIKQNHRQNKFNDVGYVIRKVSCDEPKCNAKGLALVSTTGQEKQHFCVRHNPKVLETLRKEAV